MAGEKAGKLNIRYLRFMEKLYACRRTRISLAVLAAAMVVAVSLEFSSPSTTIAKELDAARAPFVGSEVAGALQPMQIERAFPNLSFPRMVHLTHAGDGTNRLWVVLQEGRIMVFPNTREVGEAKVFLDIRHKVNRQGEEEGLLGLAFDPEYETNGLFYIYYSAADPRRSVISRFVVSSGDPNLADPESELVLLLVAQPFSNHNGGHLIFGPDGFLYIGLGDGGSGGDPLGHGQNLNTLLGSILRIDVRGATAQQPYAVPSNNPFVGVGGGVRDEIWAYGLRNPWRFNFDSVTDDLWAADVGQNSVEEIDLIEPGGNYGWNVMEGFHCFPLYVESCNQSGLALPIFEYSHTEGCSVSGGYVYRGQRLPALVGAYIYADFCSGRIWGLRRSGAAVTEQALLADTSLSIPAFGIDEMRELYILAFDGYIYRFVAPAAVDVPAVSIWGQACLAVSLALLLGWRLDFLKAPLRPEALPTYPDR